MPVDPLLRSLLVCPVDKSPLREEPRALVSAAGKVYPIVDDSIPVMIIPHLAHTFDVVDRSRAEADAAYAGNGTVDPKIWNWEVPKGDAPHPFVSKMVGATCGYMYQNMVGNLHDYPIPTLRLPSGEGKLFLDLGCNWGRWCIAARRLGYQTIGLDPVLEAIHAARTVAQQLKLDCRYIVGDAVRLPLADNSVDVVFSYSVLQHFARQDVVSTLAEIKRVLKPGGYCLIQMANTYGLRCLYHQAKRGFRDSPHQFSVRYWTPGQLKKTYSEQIGPTTLSVDGFFNLNPQPSETRLLPWRYRAIVGVSETLRKASHYLPPLQWAADSLYISSRKSG